MIAATPALAADPWPVRPVTVICPFPPGISTDILTRAVATALSNALGQQFVMENRPGANGNIGAATAAKSSPDGYTFLVATLGPAIANKFMYKTMSFDAERAFAPVALLGSSPLIIVGSPKVPAANFRELVGYARQNDLSNVSTVDESGFPGFEASGWNALLAPAGTPREIIDKVNAVVNAFLKSDDGKLQLRKLGITPLGGTPDELQAHLDRERAKWGPIIKEANISLQ